MNEPVCSQSTCGGNWALSFDSSGWSTCSSGCVMTGLTRSGGGSGELFNLEAATCCSAGSLQCTDVDISSSFDTEGWAECPANTYMNGLERSGGNSLYNVESMRCCGDATTTLTNCENYRIWSSFDGAGTVTCPGNKVMTGMYRTSGNALSNIEELKCLKASSSSLSFSPSFKTTP